VLVSKTRLIAALVALMPAAAQAQIVCANCYDQPTGILNNVAVAANWVSQLRSMQQQYTQLQYTVASLQHLNPQSLTTAAGLLNNAMRLPGSAAALIPGLNFGSNLSAAGQPFYNQNHVYTPTGTDFAAMELQRRQMATANIQGEAQTVLTTISQRVASLAQLEASIVSQPDVTAVAAINARINSEHMYLTNETNHVSNLQAMLQTQQAVDQQRAEQHDRQQAETWAGAEAAQAGF
jgi:type IV secretion system protein VirB5